MFVLVVGVGCAGESAVGRLLAEGIGGRFIDGKDRRPAENRERMAAKVISPLSVC
jgi:gluconokinase